MEKKEGSYVLHLMGSPYETGYQHGALLREEIADGAVGFYADVINGGRKAPFSLTTWFMRKFLDGKVYVPLEKSQPREVLEELKGIADGSGVPYDVVFRANHNTGPSMVLTPVLATNTIAAFGKLGIEIKAGACSTFVRPSEGHAHMHEAERIFHDNPRGVSAGYVVVSGKEKDAFAAEFSAGSAAICAMQGGRIVMTNMAVSEEKRAMDVTAKYHIMEHCPDRYRRLMDLIDANRGTIDPGKAAEFLGDHIQYTTGLERATGHIVGVSDNENSVVFSPEDLTFWVAAGPAPVRNNPHHGFSLADGLRGSASAVTPEVLRGHVIGNERIRSGLDGFLKAFALKEENPDDTDRIMGFLEAACAADPLEPCYGKLLAKYYLHAGRYDEALAAVEKVLPLQQSFRETGSGWLLTGMILDLKGERQRALACNRRIEEMTRAKQDDPWFAMNRLLEAYAEKHARTPFAAKDLADLPANIEFVDPYME